MSDPYTNSPGTNPPRHVRHDSTARWALVGIAIVLLLAVGLWEFGNRQERAASNDEPATVGQSERVPVPLPVNPNGTVPQPNAR